VNVARVSVLLSVIVALTPVRVLPEGAQSAVLSSPSRVVNETVQKGFASSRLYWEAAQLENPGSQTLAFHVAPPVKFTSLAIAWRTNCEVLPAGVFSLTITSRSVPEGWSTPAAAVGEVAPDENPSGLYWSNLYMTPGGVSQDEAEIHITLPPGVTLTQLQVMTADIQATPFSGEVDPSGETPEAHVADASRPTIVLRKDWWGTLPADSLDAHFGPIPIVITHAIVHHTAMTNNPPNPPQEIRSIWQLHVYGNGWSDIGYNFLIDQYGNIYQGRYNPQLESTDVQGAHATSTNSKSVGISVLGNFSPEGGGIPDPRALRSLEKLVAWRFGQRNLNPLESASINTNLGGPRVLPRISGHRDVGSTECPGESLYVLLPMIRTNVAALLAGTAVNDAQGPEGFALEKNWPNPFNPVTNVRYSVGVVGGQFSVATEVRLAVYDLLGREVAVLSDERKEPGTYEVTFDGSNLASGVYLCRMSTAGFVQSRRIVLLR
jgi:hypothetical protein